MWHKAASTGIPARGQEERPVDVTWIIQTNFGPGSDVGAWADAVRAAGAHAREVHVVPFSGDLRDIESPGPTVVYGSGAFAAAARAAGRWSPGVFAGPEVFTYANWAERYGAMLLNSPDGAELTTVGAFALTARDPDEPVFVRPRRDAKTIAGGVRTAGEFRDWCARAVSGGFDGVGPETEIAVCRPYGIEAEWRLFVVDDVIRGVSEYSRAGRTSKVRGAPEAVLRFGRAAAAAWSPAPAYVLDVCLSAGNPYIVEAQDLHSAGHYAADLGPVVAAVNAAAVREWAAARNPVPEP